MAHDPDDRWMMPIQLSEKYNPDGDGEHPTYSRWDWAQAVAQRSTLEGYWDWVLDKLSVEPY